MRMFGRQIFQDETWTTIVTTQCAQQLVLVGADLQTLHGDYHKAIQQPTNIGLIVRGPNQHRCEAGWIDQTADL